MSYQHNGKTLTVFGYLVNRVERIVVILSDATNRKTYEVTLREFLSDEFREVIGR